MVFTYLIVVIFVRVYVYSYIYKYSLFLWCACTAHPACLSLRMPGVELMFWCLHRKHFTVWPVSRPPDRSCLPSFSTAVRRVLKYATPIFHLQFENVTLQSPGGHIQARSLIGSPGWHGLIFSLTASPAIRMACSVGLKPTYSLDLMPACCHLESFSTF